VLRVWHMGGSFEQTLEGHTGGIYCLAQGGAAPSGAPFIFSGGDDCGVKTWQFGESQTFEPVIELTGHASVIQAMKVAGNTLLSAERNGLVIMWDLSSGQKSGEMPTAHGAPLMALWIEDTFLFTAALDGKVKVWDSNLAMVHEHQVTNRNNQPSGVTSIVMVSEGSAEAGGAAEMVLVTACDDVALKLWRMPGFDKRGILASREGHQDVVRCMAKGPGNTFFSGGMDFSICAWEFGQ